MIDIQIAQPPDPNSATYIDPLTRRTITVRWTEIYPFIRAYATNIVGNLAILPQLQELHLRWTYSCLRQGLSMRTIRRFSLDDVRRPTDELQPLVAARVAMREKQRKNGPAPRGIDRTPLSKRKPNANQ